MANAIRLRWINGYVGFQVTFTEFEIKAKEIFECSWDGGVVTTGATCGADGVRTYTCSKCAETKEIVIPATGEHAWNEGTVTLEPTESSSGSKLYTCTVCSTTKTEVLPAVGHNWDNGTVVAPDCDNDGYTLFKCTDNGCEATYKDSFVTKLGHTYNDGVETKHPTLTAEGELTFSCTRDNCDEAYTETIPMATIADDSFVLGIENIISFEEYISSGVAHESRDYNKLFDGIKVNASNSQSNPGGWFAPKDSTLTIVFDEEYYILGIDYYVWSNWNGATIEFFDGNGYKVIHYSNGGIQQTGGLATTIEEAPGKLIKSMKITINSAKGAEGVGNCLDFQEFVILAHKHKAEGETEKYDEVLGCVDNFGSYKKYCYVCEKEVVVQTAPVGSHDLSSEIDFSKGYDMVGTVSAVCSRCDFDEKTRIQPLFYSYGYSVREDGKAGISHRIEINKEAIEKYNMYVSTPIEFGFVAAAAPNFDDAPLVIESGAVVGASNKVSIKKLVGSDYVCFEDSIVNIPESAYDTGIVLTMYISCSYLTSGTSCGKYRGWCNNV